jgi:hypothetical protein
MSAGTRAPGRKMNPVIVAENRHSRAGDYHNSQRQPGRLRVSSSIINLIKSHGIKLA